MPRHALRVAIGVLLAAALAGPARSGEPLDPPAIRAALAQREFDVLETRMLEAREAWKADRGSAELKRLVEVFRELGRAEAEALYQWNHERPASAPARLALTAHYMGEAWRARGKRFVRDTSADQLARMRDFCVRVAGAAQETLALDPGWIDAHRLRMEAARLTGDDAAQRQALAAALALAPDDLGVRWTYAKGLTPRWGGSYPALDAFAAQAQVHAASNPKLALLLGRSDADRGELLSANERYEEAVVHFDRALRHGDEPHTLSDRGWALYRLGRHAEAKADLERAIALEPADPQHHVRMAFVLSQLRDFDRADAAFAEAERLDPSEPYYREKRLELAKWRADVKLHQQLEREAPIPYAVYRTSYRMLRHAAAVAAAASLLWLGWRIAGRRRVPARAAAAAAPPARTTLDGVSRLLLQAYAGLLTVYHAWIYSWGWARGTRSEAEDYLDLAITAVALAGILGFAYRRRLAGADLWKAVAVLFPAWNFVYQIQLEGGSLALVGTWLPIHVMLLPGYVSLFLYGYGSETLWEPSPIGAPTRSPHRA